MPEKKSDILIIIPAYNAARYINDLITRITKAVPQADILAINDGSGDNTAEVLESFDIFKLDNSRNRGKGYSLRKGFAYAIEHGYRRVVTIDADLQHLPEEIPRFLESPEANDLVIGVREISPRIMPFARWLSNYLTSLIISIFAGQRIRDSQTGYRLFNVTVLPLFRPRSWRYDYESEILFQTGTVRARVGEVPISTIYEESKSSIHPVKDTFRFIRLIWQKLFL